MYTLPESLFTHGSAQHIVMGVSSRACHGSQPTNISTTRVKNCRRCLFHPLNYNRQKSFAF